MMWKNHSAELDIAAYSPALGHLLEVVTETAVEHRYRQLGEGNLLHALLTLNYNSIEFQSLDKDAQADLVSARAMLENHRAPGVSVSDCRNTFAETLLSGRVELNPFARESWRDGAAEILEALPEGAGVAALLSGLFESADRLEDGSLLEGLFDSGALLKALAQVQIRVSLFGDGEALDQSQFRKRALFLLNSALSIAARTGEARLQPYHLLLSLAAAKDTYARLVLKKMGLAFDITLQDYLGTLYASGDENAVPLKPVRGSFSDRSIAVLEDAAKAGTSAGRPQIGERELLSALSGCEDPKLNYVAGSVLRMDWNLLAELLRDTDEPEVIEPRLPREACECTNLTLRHGSPTIREPILQPIIRAFFRRKNRNVLLYGDSGVGMSTVGEMLASVLAEGRFSALAQTHVIRFDLTSPPPEQYESAVEKVLGFMEEEPERICFLEGFGPYFCDHFASCARRFSRNEYRLVVCVSKADYTRLQNMSEVLSDFIEPVEVTEPNLATAVQMTENALAAIEAEYGVTFAKNAAQTACRMAGDYLISQRFPKKSIELLTRTAADVAADAEMKGLVDRTVKKEDIAKRLSAQTGLPVETILGTGADKDYVYLLSQTVVGQDVAVGKVAARLDLIQKGMVDKKAPAAVFVFAGLSGTGKTELAKQIAQIYSSSRKLITFAMANFGESHSVSQMIGTPPGYVGYEEGGKLINDLNRDPYSVVLLDEIEKAHPAVWDPFLNLFDEGVITDMRGVTASGSQAFFVLTSNIGQYDITRMLREGRPMDEISQTVEKQFVEHVHFKTGQRCFRPEFIGRIMRRGGIVAFNALSEEALRGIARHMFDKVARDYSGVHESKLICDDAVINMIAHMVYEENEETIRHKGDGYYGGRRLDIMMNEHVTNKLAAQIRQLAGAPMVRVILNGSKTELVPVFSDGDMQQIMQQRRIHLLDRVNRRFADIVSLPDDAFDELDEDKLKTLDSLLSQIQSIH